MTINVVNASVCWMWARLPQGRSRLDMGRGRVLDSELGSTLECSSVASSTGGQRDSRGSFPGEGKPALASENGPGRKSGHSAGVLLKCTSCLLSLATL